MVIVQQCICYGFVDSKNTVTAIDDKVSILILDTKRLDRLTSNCLTTTKRLVGNCLLSYTDCVATKERSNSKGPIVITIEDANRCSSNRILEDYRL